MAGGKGSRLQMGEKGLVRLCQRPLISYVIDALISAGMEPVVITTGNTPYTANYCRAFCLNQICTQGAGYVEDIVETVTILEEKGPILTICADIPGITSDHLNYIITRYKQGGTEACSVWIPAELFAPFDHKPHYIQKISGVEVVPAGINILLGEKIGKDQDELSVIIADPSLAYNINTRHELDIAESFFFKKRNGLSDL